MSKLGGVEGEALHAILFPFRFGGYAAETEGEEKISGACGPRTPRLTDFDMALAAAGCALRESL